MFMLQLLLTIYLIILSYLKGDDGMSGNSGEPGSGGEKVKIICTLISFNFMFEFHNFEA